MRTTCNEVITPSVWERLIRFLQFNPAFVTALLLVAGLAITWSPRRPHFPLRLDRVADVKGWVSRTPEIRGDSIYFELSPQVVRQQQQEVSYAERIAVWVSSTQKRPENLFLPPLQYGEILRFRTFLREPTFYAIPGVQDHRWLAWLQGAPFRIQLKSPLQLERLGQTWIGLLTHPFFHYLQWFENYSQKALKDQSFRLLLGVFLGRKRSLEDTEKDSVRDVGILHLFVVSGFHISLIVFLLHSVFRVLGRFGCLATVLGIWLYILAIGFPLAAVRAGIIASVAYFLISIGLQRNLLNGLGISALLIAVLNPKSVFTASFHLSYICLCAIGLLALPCMRYVRAVQKGIEDLQSTRILLGRTDDSVLRRKTRFLLEATLRFVPHELILLLKRPLARTLAYILMLLLCSFCIQMLLFPIAIHYTNRWSLTQAFSNLLLMPLFSLLIALCFLFFLTFWTPLGPLLAWSLENCSDLSHHLIHSLAAFSPVAFLPQPKWCEILAYLTLILFLSLALPRRTKPFALVPPVCLLLVLGQPSRDLENLVITVLDVGQGESIHLRYPTGEDALIDTGGLPYPPQGNFVGERLVSRYLWNLRIKDLLYVLITHPDSDHKKGYSFIKKAFPINHLIYSELHPDYEEPKRRVLAGDTFSVGGVRHLIHHPSAQNLKQLSRNQASIVFTLRYRDFSMLFTGDIESQVERELLSQLTQVTVLKVAHHGSNTSSSSEFLSVTRPSTAIISAGRDQKFGHPSPSVLNRLEATGARVFSTKSCGSLRLITDGTYWEIQRFSMRTDRFEDLIESGTEIKKPQLVSNQD